MLRHSVRRLLVRTSRSGGDVVKGGGVWSERDKGFENRYIHDEASAFATNTV